MGQHQLYRRRQGLGDASPPSSQPAPYDQNAVSSQVLKHTANLASAAMLPVAELSPMGSVPANAISVATVATSSGINIQWPCNGFIVGIRATTRDGLAASMCGTLLRVLVNGQDELFPAANGGGAGYLPFAMISGNAAFLGRYAVRRAFQQATYWVIFVQNTTGGTVVSDVSFDYINTSTPRT